MMVLSTWMHLLCKLENLGLNAQHLWEKSQHGCAAYHHQDSSTEGQREAGPGILLASHNARFPVQRGTSYQGIKVDSDSYMTET